MSYTLSTGSTVSIAKVYGASITVTAATNSVAAGYNATTTLTTGSAHGLVSGDYVEVTSGWGRLNQRIARCTTGTTASTIVLENIDTYNTSRFPSGAGIGSVRKITAWTSLSQIKSVSSGGGDQQYADATGLEDVVQRQIPTKKSAVTMDLEVYDDPSMPWYGDVKTASDAVTPYGLMIAPPNGSKIVANAYWSISDVPNVAMDEVLTTKLSLSYVATPTRYAS